MVSRNSTQIPQLGFYKFFQLLKCIEISGVFRRSTAAQLKLFNMCAEFHSGNHYLILRQVIFPTADFGFNLGEEEGWVRSGLELPILYTGR